MFRALYKAKFRSSYGKFYRISERKMWKIYVFIQNFVSLPQDDAI